MEAADELAGYVRDEASHLVASLTRQLGNFELAEDAVQDAIIEALQHWPQNGVPHEPGAWLRVTAKRKATDRLRREARYRGLLQLVAQLDDQDGAPAAPVADDRLVLLFMCCHPSLSREAQIALTLRSLLGMTTAQLAKAFLTSEATMTKRIVRGKRKIVDAGIPLAVPTGDEARSRLSEVLACIYVMFNEGYLSAGPDAERAELAADAQWLASLVTKLIPDEPETIGLLALVELHQARRAARFGSDGEIVLLQHQDRSLWDHSAIDEALAKLNTAMRHGQPGFYQCQAAIAGCHASARSWEATDWHLIGALYDQLVSLSDSPVAALNRAIAIMYRDGPAEALKALEPAATELDSYHLYHAARADILRALGHPELALQEDRLAAELTANPSELHLLNQRIDKASLIEFPGLLPSKT